MKAISTLQAVSTPITESGSMTSELDFDGVHEFLRARSARFAAVANEDEWRTFRSTSQSKNWVYLIKWTDVRFCWGTSAGKTDRIRKSSLFNRQLSGKYDRRVDYLMLDKIHGPPAVRVFEIDGDPRSPEAQLKEDFAQRHCYRGFDAGDREAIARLIIREFMLTKHYSRTTGEDREMFDEFLEDVYLAKLYWKGRSFHWGDSLEPKFLRNIGKGYLEPTVERVLEVRFPR